MRIQNNIMAMNTHRMYTVNNTNVAKSAEKLSSGYRINRAGDDAAGLAISEKMRAQIRGLNMASKNSQDAVSLIQTAEGALQEVHSMLQRMNELANQSATGTNETFDRQQIDAEFNQLKNEIDQVAMTTTFNNMNLLDGSLASDAANVTVDAASTLKDGATLIGGGTGYTVTKHTGLSNQEGDYTIADEGNGKIKVTFTDDETGNQTNTTIDLSKVVTGEVGNGKSFNVDLSEAGLGTYTFTADNTGAASISDLAAALATGTVGTEKVATDTTGAVGKMVGTKAGVAANAGAAHVFEIDLAGITLATGGTANDTISLTIDGETITSNALDTTAGAKDATAIATALNGKTFTKDGVTYTAANSGTKLTFTAGAAGANKMTAATFSAAAGTGTMTGALTSAAATTKTAGSDVIAEVKGEAKFTADVSQLTDGAKMEIDGKTYVFRTPDGEADTAAGEELVILAAADVADNDAFATAIAAAIGANTAGGTYDVADNGDGTITFTQATGANKSTADLKAIATFTPGAGAAAGNEAATNKGALKIQVGANEGEQLEISVAAMNAKGLGIANSSIADQTKAGEAITATQEAINLVSEQRATLGAMQNRLEHKIANLDNTSENLSSAESRIRDVDMAKEMTNFTKNNILAQAATAMLAQANSAPQGVLSLLQ